jgi:hypothetical protein
MPAAFMFEPLLRTMQNQKCSTFAHPAIFF